MCSFDGVRGSFRVVSYLSEFGADMYAFVFGGVVVPEVIEGQQYYSVYRADMKEEKRKC